MVTLCYKTLHIGYRTQTKRIRNIEIKLENVIKPQRFRFKILPTAFKNFNDKFSAMVSILTNAISGHRQKASLTLYNISLMMI